MLIAAIGIVAALPPGATPVAPSTRAEAADRAAAAARGVSPGGDIFIHGAPDWWVLPGQPPGDRTQGCVAVTDAEIEEIWSLVADGTPIEIRP